MKQDILATKKKILINKTSKELATSSIYRFHHHGRFPSSRFPTPPKNSEEKLGFPYKKPPVAMMQNAKSTFPEFFSKDMSCWLVL